MSIVNFSELVHIVQMYTQVCASSPYKLVANTLRYSCNNLILIHQDNLSLCFIHPNTQFLYSKSGIHYFLIFALKHILWVLVIEAVLTCTHSICFEQKYENS